MYCSNEVILVDTSCARYVSETSFDNVDTSDVDSVLNIKWFVSKQHYSTIKERLFKIVDVKFVDTEILNNNPHPMAVIIEREYDKTRILCRAKDLIYMDSRLCMVDSTYEIGETPINQLSIVGNPPISFDSAYDYIHLMDSSSSIRHLHRELQNMWKDRLFVDSTDSRALSKRTFLRKENTYFLNILFSKSSDLNYYFHTCSNCDVVDINHKEVRSKFYCNSCKNTALDSCDVCRSAFPIAELLDTKIEFIGSRNEEFRAEHQKLIKEIFSNVDVQICCKQCSTSFYSICGRCSKVDYVDFDTIRLKTRDEKEETYNNFIRDVNKLTIHGESYCSKCSTLKATSLLDRPYKFKSLPKTHHGKSEFTRFVGIESEVITNYDDTEYYLEEGDIPDYFEAIEDGSLSSCGVEFRTQRPVIGETVDKALSSLESVNRYEDNWVDSSCGVHIHMNAIDFDFVDMQSVLMIMSRLQHTIYNSLPSERIDNTYCKEIKLRPEKIASIKTLPELINTYYRLAESKLDDNKYNTARYFGTNIHARFLLGSIEFRYHEGEIYSEPIRDWIKFLNRVMDKSTTLSNNKDLYSKIISNKTSDLDILREVCGDWGVSYIENKTENNKIT